MNMFKNIVHNEDSPLFERLKHISADKKILLIAGSVPEEEGGKLYNTSYVFDDGRYLGKHRKVHLFDVNIPGGIVFRESDVFTAGRENTVLDTKFGKIGVAICFDLRFPEMIKAMALAGAKMIFAPAAFNTTTGPLHWELVLRARALDSQTFLCACSPARNMELSYHAWGHSAIVGPMGEIVGMCREGAQTLICEIDSQAVDEARRQLPLLTG